MKAHEDRHVVLSTRQNIRDRLCVPLPTACRGYPSGVECLCNLPQRTCARLLSLANDHGISNEVTRAFLSEAV
jgi:hypothetical protein